MSILTVIGSILINGMFLLGIPSAEDVAKITVAYTDNADSIREYTMEDKIETSVKLANFLRYDPFAQADDPGEPLDERLVYVLQDGSQRVVSANHSTVWWQGRAHALKSPSMFVNLTEGGFIYSNICEGGDFSVEKSPPSRSLPKRRSGWGNSGGGGFSKRSPSPGPAEE